MSKSIARRRPLILAATMATTLGLAGCYDSRGCRRPIGQGVREYLAARPSYDAAPVRTLTIGSYAGYNYGPGPGAGIGGRPARGTSPTPMIGD